MPSFCYSVKPYEDLILSAQSKDDKKFYYYSMLTGDFLLYLILYLYLDEVLPNEYGTNKHPLFFLGFHYASNSPASQEQSSIDLGLNKQLLGKQNFSVEDFSSAIYHEIFENVKQVKVPFF